MPIGHNQVCLFWLQYLYNKYKVKYYSGFDFVEHSLKQKEGVCKFCSNVPEIFRKWNLEQGWPNLTCFCTVNCFKVYIFFIEFCHAHPCILHMKNNVSVMNWPLIITPAWIMNAYTSILWWSMPIIALALSIHWQTGHG